MAIVVALPWQDDHRFRLPTDLTDGTQHRRTRTANQFTPLNNPKGPTFQLEARTGTPGRRCRRRIKSFGGTDFENLLGFPVAKVSATFHLTTAIVSITDQFGDQKMVSAVARRTFRIIPIPLKTEALPVRYRKTQSLSADRRMLQLAASRSSEKITRPPPWIGTGLSSLE